MGTRGCYGFFKEKLSKVTYNHFDSYPTGLGSQILDFIKNTSIEDMNKIFNKIILVDEENTPTKEQIENCKRFLDTTVGNQDEKDFYCLLRGSQGDLGAYKTGLKYMIDAESFMGDSLFCEYAYIINLDKNSLEFYTGFNTVPQHNRYSRFADNNEKYKECKLVAKIELSAIQNGSYTIKDLELEDK